LAILNQAIRTVAAAGRSQYTEQLRPLLKHADVQVAVLLVQSIGEATAEHRNSQVSPSLVLDALQSEREPVVSAAVSWAENCAQGPHRGEVQRALLAIFEGHSEPLKFQVAGPLTREFQHPAARDYLLEQTQHADVNRRYMTLSWLCNPRQPYPPADEKLLNALAPLLKSNDAHTRYMASIALASYSGEVVVKNLLPLLADSHQVIPTELTSKLLQQPDKQMLRRLLGGAAKEHSNEKVRQQAAALLHKLEQQGK
jgi:hypothetical protein